MRRTFVQFMTMTALLFVITQWLGFGQKKSKRYLRPPGALNETDFLKTCLRCDLCGQACPNQCIKYFASGDAVGTPFIDPRDQACILCMKCTQICPSGALQKIPHQVPAILERVHMGTAVIDTNICYSYNGKTCGVCYRACPLQGKAMTIGLWEVPTVHPEFCVGCGLCEKICYHIPQAIRIFSKEEIPA